MSVTSTQSKNPADANQVAVGSYIDTGTAAAVVITIGFRPRYVKVINETDKAWYEWYEGMADAEAFKQVTNGDTTFLTSLGITPSASGFTIGLDTDINKTSEQVHWIAIQ